MNYTATIDDIGKWDGQEAEAVNCWNRYIAPALAEIDEQDEEEAFYTATVAREKFCGTTDEESWDELGLRVAKFVQA